MELEKIRYCKEQKCIELEKAHCDKEFENTSNQIECELLKSIHFNKK